MSRLNWLQACGVVLLMSCTPDGPQQQTPVTRSPAKLPERAQDKEGASDQTPDFPFDRDQDNDSQNNSSGSTGSTNSNQGSSNQPGSGSAAGSQGNSGSGSQGSSGSSSSNSTNGSSSNSGSGSSGAASNQITYQSHIKSIFDRACVSCHAPTGSRSQSPLESFANAKKFGELSNIRVQASTMPPPASPSLSDEEKRLVKAWVDGGMLEVAAANNNSSAQTTPSDADLVGTWTGEQDEYSTAWSLVNREPGAAPSPSVSPSVTPSVTPSTSPSGSAGSATVVAYDAEVKSLLDRNCVSCHRPGGSRASSPLNDYASAVRFASASNGRIQAGTMPRSGPLSAADKAIFDQWVKGGTQQRKPASGSSSTPPGAGINPGADSATGPKFVTEFRIKAGTGSGDWNDKAGEVLVKVGTKFTLHNDDSVVHQWHTNGSPCSHGSPIQPGRSATCDVTAAYSGTPTLYDHNTNGKFFIRAER
jgi:mono/diheme cytochrome c family protein